MLSKFLGHIRPEFLDSIANVLRTNKNFKKDVAGIEIPSHKFFSKDYIAALFLQHGRIPTNIDTTTFRNRVMIACEDGEMWSGRINLSEKTSVFLLQLPIFEEQANGT